MTYETGRLEPETVRGMFDRIAPVYDVMNRVMTAGLDQRWRKLAVNAVVWPGDRVLDACCGTGDLAVQAERRGGRVVALDFSPKMLERARKKSGAIEWVQGDALALPFADGDFDAATVGFGVRNLADLEGGLKELARVLRPGGKLAVLEITRPRGILRPFFRLLVRRARAVRGPRASRAARPTRTCRRASGASPARMISPRSSSAPASRASTIASSAVGSWRCTSAASRARLMTALEVVRAAPGLDDYLAEVEAELGRVVERYPGLVAEVGASALAAGGKRLRPALAFLSSSPHDPHAARRRSRGRARAHGDARPRRPDRRSGGPSRSRSGLERARRGGGESGRRLPLRAGVLRARCDGQSERRRGACRRIARARSRRGDAAPTASRPRHDDRGLSRALRAQDGKALRGRVRARRRKRRVRAAARVSPSRSPTTSSTAPARRSRRERCRAPTSETARRRCRSCWPRRRTRSSARRSRAVRTRARSSASRRAVRSTGLASWPSTTLRRPGLASTARRVGTSSRR